MQTYADPYADLGLKPGADEDAVRRAFRRLAFELHPDHNTDPAATEAFVRVRKAYEELLSDPSRLSFFTPTKQPETPKATTETLPVEETEAVIYTMTRAAAEASRRRMQAEAIKPITVNVPAPPSRFGLVGLPSEQASRMVLRLSLSTVLILLLAVVLGNALLVAAGCLNLVCALTAWFARYRPTDLCVTSTAFTDSRWAELDGIAWSDVTALRANVAARTLDLQIRPGAATRLWTTPHRPKDVLVEEGPTTYYRLALRGAFDRMTELAELRTGLSAR